MTRRRLLRLAAAWCLVLGASGVAMPPAGAADRGARFETPVATARLGEPLTFSSDLRSDVAPGRVELLTRLPAGGPLSVQIAEVSETADGTFRASVQETGHAVPNTTFRYRFRALMPDGSVVDGPDATATVVDPRFEWRTRQGSIIRLHWYEGDDAFADRALAIGEEAIEQAAELLGVTETEPLDFFIYASEGDLREALGPGTRENVGGQANASLRTMFGLIEPSEVGSDWVDVLVTHELTHLVFDTAVRNAYHDPPRWLNEGVAVYLSEGLSPSDSGSVRTAAERGTLIPLEGLGGLFPTTRDRFNLAYAESVSAVSFFIDTYGEDRLVRLIRSYADGVTDDEAFTAATGADLSAFDAAWIASLGADVPEPFGPLPAPPGPLPPGWDSEPGAPDPIAGPSGSPTAAGEPDEEADPTFDATPVPTAQLTGEDRPVALLAIGALVAGSLLLVGALMLARWRREA